MNPETPPPPLENDRITHEPGKSHAIIARLDLIRTSPSGERFPVSLALGAPYITLDGFWRTPVRVGGIGAPSPEIYGEDSLQALYRAMEIIRHDLATLAAQGDKLTRSDGSEFSLKEYRLDKK